MTVDVRVIAATNKDLETEIEKGNFREDLYYRLNVVPIEVPALRQRLEDLPLLVETFLDELAKQNQTNEKEMAPDAIELLTHYDWPGNVRELKNLVERLAIMSEQDIIEAADLPEPYNPSSAAERPAADSRLLGLNGLKEAKKEFEKEFIQQKLVENQNNITRTAESIGVGRSYLHKKLKEIKD